MLQCKDRNWWRRSPTGSVAGDGREYQQLKEFLKKALRNQMEGRLLFVDIDVPHQLADRCQSDLGLLRGEMARYFKVGELRVPEPVAGGEG